MAERRVGDLPDAEAQMGHYLRSDKAAHLLERGAIRQTEFEAIKAKALA